MEIKPWYVHGISYDLKTNKYSVVTTGPFPSLDEAFTEKKKVTDSRKFAAVEVSQSSTFYTPTLS